MKRAVAEVLDRLHERPTLPGGGRLLCIDGPPGSGKTTLAAAVTESFGDSAHVLHMDDLYAGWHGLDQELPRRVQSQLTAPFSRGEPGCYRRYDWWREEFAEPRVVPAVDLLVLEGVGSGDRLLAAERTLLVWVDAPQELRDERGLERDRALHDRAQKRWDGADYRRKWEGFVADAQRHFARNHLPDLADLAVVEGAQRRR